MTQTPHSHPGRIDHGRTDQRGFTVIELSVVLMIMMILSFTLFGFLDSVTRATARQTNQSEAQQAATIAMRRLTEDLRSATAISACNAVTYSTCITFSVPAQGPHASCPEHTATYQLSGTSLLESETTYSSSCVATTALTNYAVLTGVVNDSSHPLFAYYDASGNLLNVSTQYSCTTPTTTTSCVPSAADVNVTLQATYTSATSPITLSNLVALRNNR